MHRWTFVRALCFKMQTNAVEMVSKIYTAASTYISRMLMDQPKSANVDRIYRNLYLFVDTGEKGIQRCDNQGGRDHRRNIQTIFKKKQMKTVENPALV